MLQMPLRYGFAPKRWKKFNDKEQPREDRLRNILILEADYNFILKLIWGKRLMRRATDQYLLHMAYNMRDQDT